MTPLFPHFSFVSEPVIDLSDAQLKAVETVKQKIENGTYVLEEAAALCGTKPKSSEARLIAARDRYGLNIRTWLSLRSGLLWTSPRLNSESLARFYRDDYRFMYTGAHGASHDVHMQQISRGLSIRHWIQSQPGVALPGPGYVVFDTGCSTGGALEPFRDLGCQVFGCDYGEQYLRYGRKRGLTLEHGFVDALSKYGKADVIILSHVLEHVAEPLDLLHRLKENLKPNGLLYVAVPGARNITYDFNKFQNDFLRFLHIAHVYHFTQNTLTVAGSKLGLEPIASDESVRVLFRNVDDARELEWDPDEAGRVVEYLKEQETIRLEREQARFTAVRGRRSSVRRVLNKALFPLGGYIVPTRKRRSLLSSMRKVAQRLMNWVLALFGVEILRVPKG